jgi:hypothetical protein
LLNHPLGLPVRSSNSFFSTRYRFLLGHLRNIRADLFLVWVDELEFVRFLFLLIPPLSVVPVTPFGSYSSVPITVLGSVHFVS